MMVTKKNPEKSLKLKYKKMMELSMMASLSLLIFLFQAFKVSEMRTSSSPQKVDIPLEVQEIPRTEQITRPPAPSRPAIPIESEDEDISEDETIETTEIDLTELPPPPQAPESETEEPVRFLPYDEMPMPIGGQAAIQRNLEYPEMARKAGVEGTVIVWVTVSETGEIINTEIIKSLGNNGCDEAAIKAIKSVPWKPGMQRDTPVPTRVSMRIRFTLQ